MNSRLSFVLVLSILWFALTPFVLWAAQAAEKHDCRQERPKGSYYCEHGPLAGKRFASRKAMVEALKNRFAAKAKQNDGKASSGAPRNVKASDR